MSEVIDVRLFVTGYSYVGIDKAIWDKLKDENPDKKPNELFKLYMDLLMEDDGLDEMFFVALDNIRDNLMMNTIVFVNEE